MTDGTRHSRLRRAGGGLIAAFTALALAACSGQTTGASKIALQADGTYSAQLGAAGTCSTTCTAYVRWRALGTGGWTNGAPLTSGTVTKVPFSQTASGLTASTLYEYQVCGKEAASPSVMCVGPDGTSNTTQTFNTGPSATTVRATWTQLHPASSPSPRAAVAAYDPVIGQTVLFGGYDANGFSLGDTWTWSGSTWTQWHPATSPPARSFQQMAYDAATGELLLFGGTQIPNVGFADTWEWTGSNWVALHPPISPPNRDDGQLAYDPATRQVVLFGGFQYQPGSPYGNLENDTWTWDGATWTQQHPAASPPPTSNGQLAYDPAIGKLVLFGGEGSTGTWAWDGTTWSQLTLPVAPPTRFNEQLALDPGTGEVIATGGFGTGLLSDTWALDAGWTALAPGTPAPAVTNASLTTDPGSGHLVQFGGYASGGATSGTWVFGPLTLDAQALAAGATGLRYAQTLQATGATGVSSWRVGSGSLPPGLSLSSAGVIAGTPTATGTFTFMVTVSDASSPHSQPVGPTPSLSTKVRSRRLRGQRRQQRNQRLRAGVKRQCGASGHARGSGDDAQRPRGTPIRLARTLYVANSGADTVDVFAAGATGNVAPISVLGGSQTALFDPYAVALDSGGDLYVADRPANAIRVFAPGASGNVAPIRTISGSHTGLSGPEALAIDASGNLWVANTASNQLTEYAPGANGDVAPRGFVAASIKGPEGLTQDAAGDLLTANTFGGSVSVTPTPACRPPPRSPARAPS